MADIKRLLNKKGWTGRELGQLELTNMAVQFQQAINGEEQKPIVDEGQFQKMIGSIKDRYHGKIFNGYLSIHEWLSIQFNIAQTQLQQAQLQYRTLESFVEQAILAEDVFRYVSKLPAIMTEKQYKDAVEAGRHKWLYRGDEEDQRAVADSLPSIIERGIRYYAKQLQEKPTKPNPLKAIRKKYISQPVKSKLILESYNEVMGDGYYTLPDGRRSDQMTAEEWQAAISTPSFQKALDDLEATDGEGTAYTEAILRLRVKERNRVLFNGGTEEEAEKAQEDADRKAGLSVPCEWHYYTEPPEDLTKWDIIEAGLWEFYGLIFQGMDGSDQEYQRELEDFVTEFKDVVGVIVADLDKHYCTGKDPLQPLPIEGKAPFTSIASTPLEDWGITLFPWEALYKHDVYGFKDSVDDTTVIFDGNRRAVANGIAIIRESDLKRKRLPTDENGYYMEPPIKSSLSRYSLDAFFTESEDYATNVDIVESSRELLLSSYAYLMGYNYALDRIADIHDVPELRIFKSNLAVLDERIDALNELVPALYRLIQTTDYSDEERKKKKLQVLQDFFPPIEYKALAIPEENKPEIDATIADFSAFKQNNREGFLNLLRAIPTDGAGEGA